ncbi:hypothetical protein F7725_011851 [Dissostichus mawsoni]|uniref:Leucine rich adaptor protein 1 n=1 Tax=Dissostichus mawsoni TaxID=36200 RepID=A0A7J5ZAR7_DISMA|nr:hypothetical protein F7725_011851 [Dissostichus mawsoni]
MAEETFNESFPDLKEVENKVGRKTPESLLIWMRDAADGENGWRSDVRCLRSADVRILRQLVAVHEGIEAMRWLMEDRGALASHGSSLTGSLSSLATVEEASMSPCRESQSPTHLTETSGEESADHTLSTDDADTNHMEIQSLLKQVNQVLPPLSLKSVFPHMAGDGASSSPVNGLVRDKFPKSQPQDLKAGTDIVRKALLRSSRAKKDMRADSGNCSLTEQSQTDHQAQESPRTSLNNTMEEEETAPNRETALLGYDAQWCWVESLDDVMFL